MDSSTLSSILAVLKANGVRSATVPIGDGEALKVVFAPVNVEPPKSFNEAIDSQLQQKLERVLTPEDVKFPGSI